MIPFILNAPPPEDSIARLLARIQQGEPELKSQFINRYQPFVIKTVSKFLGHRFVDIKDSDEYSIGLIAFDEAVNCFNPAKNPNFFNFAAQVIRRRIINYWVTNKKQRQAEYPFEYFQKDNEDFLEGIPDPTTSFTQSYETKEEILLWKKKLADFGIKLKDLADSSPKHRDSKILAISIAKVIAANEELFRQMVARKALPALSLLKLVKVNQRTLERHRKYIIAICLILRSDLEILKSYLDQTLWGGDIR
ncbi:MAG: RNA polymerase sigma-I factor [Firmicutes bacterium]|nr:RNA polymerase sigma-I factor [Bacillota bacterium]